MGKFSCSCGNTIRISGEIPNPFQYLYISDQDFEPFGDTIDTSILYQRMNIFFKCSNCERLWFFENGIEAIPTSYLKE